MAEKNSDNKTYEIVFMARTWKSVELASVT